MKNVNSSYIPESDNSSHTMENNQATEYPYKKIQSMGHGHSGGISIPKKYLINLGLTAGDFVKVVQEDGRIIIEKV